MMQTPNFFIVGAPKCGTTAMWDFLGQHPEVFIAEKKEAHFFGSDLQAPTYFIRDREQYLSFFSPAHQQKVVGEASVLYLYSTRAAAEMQAFCPSAKILIMLRNPVDMLYALHSQFVYGGNEQIEDFAAALEAEGDRERGLRLAPTTYLAGALLYRRVAGYTEQIRRYLEAFGPEQVHSIIYEDFQKDTAATYRAALRFLAVNEDIPLHARVVNPNKTVRSKALRNLLKFPSPLARRVGRSLLPRRVRSQVAQSLKEFNTVYAPRGPMDPALRQRLQREFAPEVERLSALLGRDLTYWSKS